MISQPLASENIVLAAYIMEMLARQVHIFRNSRLVRFRAEIPLRVRTQ